MSAMLATVERLFWYNLIDITVTDLNTAIILTALFELIEICCGGCLMMRRTVCITDSTDNNLTAQITSTSISWSALANGITCAQQQYMVIYSVYNVKFVKIITVLVQLNSTAFRLWNYEITFQTDCYSEILTDQTRPWLFCDPQHRETSTKIS